MKHIGSSFDAFLEQEQLTDEVNALAIEKLIAQQLEAEMKAQNINKTQLAKLMNTSRSVVNHLLEPNNYSLSLQTLGKAAAALGKRLSVSLA